MTGTLITAADLGQERLLVSLQSQSPCILQPGPPPSCPAVSQPVTCDEVIVTAAFPSCSRLPLMETACHGAT